MTFQEFIEKKPNFIKEAKKCTSEEEFTNVAEAYGVKFGKDSFDKAYEIIVGGKGKTKLSEDALDSVSGGTNIEVTQVDLGGMFKGNNNESTFIFNIK